MNAADQTESLEESMRLIASIRASHLSYCGPPKLENLARALVSVRVAGIRGHYVEAGVALGGSAILLARLKPEATPLTLYDVFGLIPPPGEKDDSDAHDRYAVIASGGSAGLGGDTYYGYLDHLLERVKANLRQFDIDLDRDAVDLVSGDFEDTLHPGGPIAFAHVDCDWYRSVRTCIERLVPLVSPGGVIVFDDYESYSGCRRAVDELLRTERHKLSILFQARSIGLQRMSD